LSLDTGDHAHVDGCGPEPRRLIADIEHRCCGAILWRQPQQVLAACPPDIYDMVRWRRLGRRWLGRRWCHGWCRGRSRGRGGCGWSGGLLRLRLRAGKQQSRQEYRGGFAVHPLLPRKAIFCSEPSSRWNWFTLSAINQSQKAVHPLMI
jgi:hypothetical protein